MAAHNMMPYLITLLGFTLLFSSVATASEDVGGSAAEQNLQRWLHHVRLTTTLGPHYNHKGGLLPHNVSSALSSEDTHAKLGSSKGLHFNRKFCKKRVIYVVKNGRGHFTTVQGAINWVPKRNKCPVEIQIGAGTFREKVYIRRSKPHITLQGSLRGRTVIEWNDTASTLDVFGRMLGTMHSASVTVNANYFTAKNITFKNTAPAQRPGDVRRQAVALRISGDKAAFFNCRFQAHQDTLYDHRGRHYFRDCYVTGTIDFIFGYGRSFYEGAQLVALPERGNKGTITAHKRNGTTLDTGFAFVNSRITGAGMVYLGRPWGNDSRVVFLNTFMDKVVVPEGWGDWGIPDRQKTVFYAQFNCTGPGADTSNRVSWARNLTAEEAAPFLTPSFINGEKWLEGYRYHP